MTTKMFLANFSNERLAYLVKLEGIMDRLGQYSRGEIKYNIDTAIQKSMYELDKEKWDVVLEVQRKLYEEFEIDG